ncbi:NADH-quinone oxidoreductase subunit J [Buchnera aphidicola (Kurisakia onigurumii)]|uniref:NADH-quinone oxidoreductase subunit J family protein n=1 Tax=Buchnera aphidicola TaxID=9 RepID=UPI0031B68331
MCYIFYFFGLIAIFSVFLTIIQKNPVYSLLYFIIFLISISGIYYTIGFSFIAALEIIIYAGAIMVLFIFVIMTLNLDTDIQNKDNYLQKKKWIFPSFLSLILFFLFFLSFLHSLGNKKNILYIPDIKSIGVFLFGPYIYIVEISSMLLLSAIIVVFHFSSYRSIKIKK